MGERSRAAAARAKGLIVAYLGSRSSTREVSLLQEEGATNGTRSGRPYLARDAVAIARRRGRDAKGHPSTVGASSRHGARKISWDESTARPVIEILLSNSRAQFDAARPGARLAPSSQRRSALTRRGPVRGAERETAEGGPAGEWGRRSQQFLKTLFGSSSPSSWCCSPEPTGEVTINLGAWLRRPGSPGVVLCA